VSRQHRDLYGGKVGEVVPFFRMKKSSSATKQCNKGSTAKN